MALCRYAAPAIASPHQCKYLREVGQVVAVAAHLCHRVQPRVVWVTVHKHQLTVVLPCLGSTPLLQLDDDV
jgi:hypothetical protein